MFLDYIIFGDFTLGDLLVFVLVIAITILVAHLAYALIRATLQRNISKSSAKSVARLVEYVIIAIGIYLAFLEVLQLNFTGLLVSLGVVGIALAFASQQITQNAFAGIIFSFTRPMQLEDWVEVGGMPATGLSRVKDITLIHTVFRDLDGRILYVPNAFILNNKLLNYTKAGFVAVNIPLRLTSAENYARVKEIVLEEADAHPKILPKVVGEERRAMTKVLEMASFRSLYGGNRIDESMFNPQVNILDLQGTRIIMNVKIWIREPQNREKIVSEFLERLQIRLKGDNIELANS
ncbi:MAG: mechanosensitive ion channel [Methanomassiliicoccales archaeon]